MRDKPQIIADRRRITPTDFAAIQENYQQELESLLSVDDAVGNVLGALADTGELENTLIIYTSDNGFFHGEHRIRSEKVLPYWPAANVPLVMRGPGVLRGRTLKQLVANVDLAPDDPRGRARGPRAGAGRPLALRADARPHPRGWAGRSCSRTARA